LLPTCCARPLTFPCGIRARAPTEETLSCEKGANHNCLNITWIRQIHGATHGCGSAGCRAREAYNTPITAGFLRRIPSCRILGISRNGTYSSHSPRRANQVIQYSKRGRSYTLSRHSSPCVANYYATWSDEGSVDGSIGLRVDNADGLALIRTPSGQPCCGL